MIAWSIRMKGVVALSADSSRQLLALRLRLRALIKRSCLFPLRSVREAEAAEVADRPNVAEEVAALSNLPKGPGLRVQGARQRLNTNPMVRWPGRRALPIDEGKLQFQLCLSYLKQ